MHTFNDFYSPVRFKISFAGDSLYFNNSNCLNLSVRWMMLKMPCAKYNNSPTGSRPIILRENIVFTLINMDQPNEEGLLEIDLR